MVPSKIKIESFAKRYHTGTLGGKGLICFDSMIEKEKICGLKETFCIERQVFPFSSVFPGKT